MATFANIVINDGQAAPVAHTFAVAMRRENLLEWHDRSAGTIAGFKKISLSTGLSSNGTYKCTIKVLDPKLAVTAPASGSGIQPNPVAAYTCLAKLEFVEPNGSDLQARKDLLAYVTNLLSNTQIVEAIRDMAPPV